MNDRAVAAALIARYFPESDSAKKLVVDLATKPISKCQTQLDKFSREFELKWGEPMPLTRDDYQVWAARVGLDGERIAEGGFSIAEVQPLIEGRLRALRDKTEAHRAHQNEKLFPRGPLDADLTDAIVLLQTKRTDENTDRDILREWLRETEDDCPKTKSIESRIRKARGDGRTSLPKRTERTRSAN